MSVSPNGLYTIPAGRNFLRDLADGLVAKFPDGSDPLALASATVFLPTRRAVRTLSEELVRAAGLDALVLPRIVPLGDVDEDAALFSAADDPGNLDPEIPALERELVLARLVHAFRQSTGAAGGYAVSLNLARSLAHLIDEAANDDVGLAGLATIAPPDMAEHWGKSVAFLDIALKAWPAHLAEQQRLDPAERRSRAIRGYAMRLAAERPNAPFIAAGTSGSIAATADLLKVIAGLPNGAVVLDGLDTGLDGETWDHLVPSHPQHALAQLLIRFGVDRLAVGPWLPEAEQTVAPRVRLLSEAMRPPERSDAWARLKPADKTTMRDGLDGLSLLEAANEREEALAIALAIREALEGPDASIALVTADRMLARRVAAELRRWGVSADDSAGQPLAKTEAGALAMLVLEAALAGGTPVALLSLLKHPRVTLGLDRTALLDAVRTLERRVLRRERVMGGFAAARDAIAADAPQRGAMRDLLARAEAALAPLSDLARGAQPMADLVAGHAEALEALSRPASDKPALAWSGADGGIAFDLFEALRAAATAAAPRLSLAEYAIAFDSAARAAPVRPQGPRHPRLAILGLLEARLHAADLMILGGLNEGVWPSRPADDQWLNRPMRKALGLPEPEYRIGLAAHDFATLAAQSRVLLTRAKRHDGAPANPSRFLLRLTTIAEGIGTRLQAAPYADWAKMLDRPTAVEPAPRPAPRPPSTSRPRSLSVTRIEGLLRDPYAIYARYVLALKPGDALERALEARDRGTIIHKAVELYAKLPPEMRQDDAYGALIRCGEEAFGAALQEPDVSSFWWPRFERAARFLIACEAGWAADRTEKNTMEEAGSYALPGLDFTLTGTPDRIDLLKNGRIRVIDYKTGSPPSLPQVKTLLAPQLPLLALMARRGAFTGDVQAEAHELVYVPMGGTRSARKPTMLGDAQALVDEVERRLTELIAKYALDETPYPSRAGMESTRYEGDYDHLARLGEWGEVMEGEG